MLLGAVVDAGLPLRELENCLVQLKLPGTRISAHKVRRNGIVGTKVTMEFSETDHHRHLHDLETLVTESKLSLRVKNQALKVFRNLAKAEAVVHDCPVEEVHFHEVEAVDAIVDIVGTCVGFDYLGIEQLFCSPLRVVLVR